MPSAPFRRLTSCRVCGATEISVFLSLGETPLANAFVRPVAAAAPELRAPLEVMRCLRCGLVQLTVVVDPEVIFRDYAYATSASAPMRGHFDGLAAEIVERFAPAGSFVVEVGSNDGVLLRPLRERGARALGVEPAANLAAIANAEGLETVNEFFGPDVASRLRGERGAAKVVVGNNVLAHIDGLPDVARALDALLDDDGVFVAEVPYLFDLLDHVEYDTVYHEHLSYFHLAPLMTLFAQVGMQLFDVKRVPTHGGSIRMYVGRSARRAETPALTGLVALERSRLADAAAVFGTFAARVAAQRQALRAVLAELRSAGKRLAGYGATAKGNTMLNYCGIGADTLSFIADTTPYKQGLLTPGTHIPVRDESAIDAERPDVMLLLAWNYADAIVRRLDGYVARGGRFIHPIPLPRLIPDR
ncbi:MAG TPA: class I SAM-dependent methyltransferase [Candidatus Limnocylindria bacterium]|nr:class I SAM-dependent methyltransferase [Candidatus Limnocylindria bacterium]